MKPLLALLATAALAAAEDIPLSFSEFSLARTRFDKKVWADARAKNSAATPVTGLSATLICLEGEREVGRSRPVEVDILPPGAERGVSFEIAKCPFFSNYVVESTYFFGGKEVKTRFIGRDLFNPPAAERSGPIPGIAFLEVYKLVPSRQGRDVQISFVVKNAGEIAANLARIRFKFYDADQNLVREAVSPFSETFDFGKEVALSATVRDVPPYENMRADIDESTAAERNLAEGEFSGEAEVEAAGFRFEDRQDGSIRVTGRVRNGRRVGVRNVVVQIMLFKGGEKVREFMATPERPLRPEETAPFSSTMRNPPEFDDYKYTTSYEEDETLAADGPPGKDPTDFPKDPPPGPKDPPGDPPVDPKTPPEPKIRSVANLIQLMDRKWIEGNWVGEGKQSKYRGSFLVLRFKFTDKTGKTARVVQDGILEATFKAPAKKEVVAKLKVEKFAWSTDARKIDVRNAKPGMMGYDPDAETLEVVVAEYENQSDWNYTLQLKFTSGEGDVWEWKALSEPYRADAGKPTGRKK